MSNDRVIELFMANVAKVAAAPIRVTDLDSFKAAVGQIVLSGASVYCTDDTEWQRVALSAVPPEQLEHDYRSAGVCIDEVFAAIAETGSIVSSSAGGSAIQAGLLASHHVAVVSSDKIYETLDDFFAIWEGALPTNITFETGPSRTADIELTLTIGVHGPERLTIIIV